MNLFNLLGTGQDLNTGSFVTLNGKALEDSIADIEKALAKAESLGSSKAGTVISWLMGNFNKDYDLAKDLTADTFALQKFMATYKNGGTDKEDAFNRTLKNSSVILQDFVNHTDDASISVQNFFKSVTGSSSLITSLEGIGLQMLTTFGQMAVIWAVSEGIKLAVNYVKDLINQADIAKQKMEESNKAYQNTTDEIKSLNNELEENNKRIAEIKAQDVITYTDQQELTKLETANKKLERQIELGTERIRLLPTRYYLK